MYKELTASQITNDALHLLRNRNCFAERQTISSKKNRKNVVKPGHSDIKGHNLGTGIALYCEVKKLGDRLKPDQINFLLEASKAGCICMIATQGDRNDTVLIDFIEYITK